MALAAGYEEPPLSICEVWTSILFQSSKNLMEIRDGVLFYKIILHPRKLSEVDDSKLDITSALVIPCVVFPLTEGVRPHIISLVIGTRVWHLEPVLMIQENFQELCCGRRNLRAGLVLGLQLLRFNKVGFSRPLKEDIY